MDSRLSGNDGSYLLYIKKAGIVLLSHRVNPVVPSPLTDLTSVFGMGTGMAPSL